MPPNITVVDDLNDETNLHHLVILTPLLRHEGLLMSRSQNDHSHLRQPIYLMNHRFILALLSVDLPDLQLHQEEDEDLRLEEDLYDQELLKEVIVNDDHQMKKCSCSTMTLNIIITPR